MHLACRPRVLALAIAALLVAGSGTALEARPHRSPVITTAAAETAVVVPDPTAPLPTDAVPPPVVPPVEPPAPSDHGGPGPGRDASSHHRPPHRHRHRPRHPPRLPRLPSTGAQERAEAALVEAVPGVWRDALPVTIRIIEGTTSWASTTMELRIGRYHAEGRWSHLVSVIGHEFGHIIAFVHGSHAFDGAAPEGWPDPNHGPPAEAWADCVSEVFTGIVDPSSGMPPCPQPSLQWTANWLAAGPP